MATTGPVNGTLIAIYKSSGGTLTKIANATSNSFDITSDMIDVTNKDSAGWKEFITGEKGYTMSIDGIFEENVSIGSGRESWQDLLLNLTNGTLVTIVMTSNVTDDIKLTGSAYFSNLNLTAPNNDKATFTATLQGTGELTVATV